MKESPLYGVPISNGSREPAPCNTARHKTGQALAKGRGAPIGNGSYEGRTLFQPRWISSFCVSFRLGAALGVVALLMCSVAFGNPALRREVDLKRVELRPLVWRDVAYGNGPGEIGAAGGTGAKAEPWMEDAPAVGPESFCCDPDGRLLVADTLGGRVQVFSREGAFLHSVPLAGHGLCSDVATDEAGNIIVFDESSHLLGCYSEAGDLLSSVAVPRGLWRSRGPLHRVGPVIYTVADDQRDVPLATVRDGVLALVDAPVADAPGVHGADGRRYLLELDRFTRVRIEVFEDDSSVSASELPLEGVVSARFLEALEDGRFFIQTERIGDDRSVTLAVHAFGPDGSLLASSDLPENDYARWSVRLLCVDPEGAVWQAIPAQDRLKVRAFAQERQ